MRPIVETINANVRARFIQMVNARARLAYIWWCIAQSGGACIILAYYDDSKKSFLRRTGNGEFFFHSVSRVTQSHI